MLSCLQVLTLVAASLILVSCGDSEADNTQAPPPSVSPSTISSAYDAINKANCEKFFRCPVAHDDEVGLRLFFSSQGDCEQLLGRWWKETPAFEDLERLAQAGKTHVDDVLLQACLQDMATSCSQSSVPSCSQVFVGTAKEGQDCHRDAECEAGLFCNTSSQDAGPFPQCPGTCEQREAEATSCARTAQCQQALVCDFDTARQEFACQQPKPYQQGEEGEDCRTCSTDQECGCKEGLACFPETETCAAAIDSGQPCTEQYDDLCANGNICEDSASGLLCQPVQLVGLGGACVPAESDEPKLKLCDPRQGVGCSTTGQCVAAGKEGEPCLAAWDEKYCDRGLFCNDDRTCEARRDSGTSCNSNQECNSGICDWKAGSCASQYCGETK